MKKYLKFCLPFLLASGSLIGCARNSIKITLNAGLGYFTDFAGFAEKLDDVSDVIAYSEKTFDVSAGTSFRNFNYPLPSLCNDIVEDSVHCYPLFWTDENNEIVKETDVFKSNTTLTAHYFTNLEEIKSVAMRTYMQGLTGAIKRCVMSSQPIDCLLKLSNIMDFEFARTDSPYFSIALGKTGAAIADALGATQRYDVFGSIPIIISRHMFNINNHCASEASSFFQGVVGVLKRVVSSRPDTFNFVAWENYINKSISAIIEAGPTKAAYLCDSLSALSDEMGEMGLEEDPMQLELNDFICEAFIKAKDVPQGLAVGRATFTFIGQLKRMLTSSQDVENFVREYKNKINILLSY